MRISINVKAQSAFRKLGAVALITATIFFVACNQTGGGGGTQKPKHAITFSVDSTTPNGTLKAKADGVDETSTSPINVEEGKTVTFTAEPSANYKVKEWKVGDTVVANNKTNTYTHTVKKPANITVSFEELSKYAIIFIVEGGNGVLKAKADGIDETSTSPINVEEGKTVTFTATAHTGYRLKEWKLDGNAVNGTNSSYSFPVTKAAEVKVSFENTPPDVGSFEDTGDGFVKIIHPANGIVGVDPDYTLPGTEAWWKGVFRAGRKVKLSPYKLGKTEVTYKLWKEVYDEAIGKGYVFANAGQKGSDGTGNDEEQPVTVVSWRDCIVWCNAYTEMKLGSDEQCVYRESNASGAAVLKDATKKVEGSSTEFICDKAYADMKKKGFRLPTEAEWEYAARWQGSDKTNAEKYGDVWLTKLNSASGAKKPIGFSGLTLPEGETWESLRDEVTRVAVYDEWWDGSNWVDQPTEVTKTAAVKSKAENAIGLYDMSGNAWEWCFDWYGDIEANTVTDPQGGASGTNRVKRGGRWYNRAGSCTVGRRDDSSPDRRSHDLGFRLAWCP